MVDEAQRREFEAAFVALLVRFGAAESGLAERVATAIDETLSAFASSADDGSSLSALDVLRIRAGKFAAARVPAAIFRDPQRLGELRSEIRRLAAAMLQPELSRGSRF